MHRVVGTAGEVPPGGARAFDVDGMPVAVAKVHEKFFAFSDLCTHQGCSLARQGVVEGTELTCGCHGSRFDIATGAVLRGPATQPLDTYPLQVVDDELHLVIDEPERPSPPERVEMESVLRNVPLFAGLDPATIETIEAFAFRRTFAPGELIVEEGRTGNGLYVILSGKVEVVKGLGTPSQLVLATLRQGEPFGELALLGDWKRTASVVAVDEVACAGIDRWVFLAHLRREPELAIKMLQFIAERLVTTDAQLGGTR